MLPFKKRRVSWQERGMSTSPRKDRGSNGRGGEEERRQRRNLRRKNEKEEDKEKHLVIKQITSELPMNRDTLRFIKYLME